MMAFPSSILDLQADLDLAGTWTSITPYVYSDRQKPGIQRGRPDESSQAVASAASLQLRNTDYRFSPHNPTGAYYGNLGRNTPLRLSVPEPVNYLRLEDDAVSNASAPTAAALNLAGDLEARIDLNLANWTTTVLAKKWSNSSGNFSWAWLLNSDATLTFQYSGNGTAIQAGTSTVPLPWPGGRISLKVTYNHTTGAVSFYYATSIGGTYTQLGSSVTITTGAIFAGTASLFVGEGSGQYFNTTLTGDNTSFPVVIGQSFTPATYGSIQGQVYEFQLRNGIGGALVADPVFSSQSAGAASFADAQANTWTLGGSATISGRKYRFHGEVGEWPQNADQSGTDVYVTVQANGLLRRITQNSNPLDSAFTRAWKQKTGIYAPLAYWPCEEGSKTSQIASGLAGGKPMTLGTRQASFAANTDFICSNALPVPNKSTWTGEVNPYTVPASGPANVCRLLLSVPSGGDTDTAVLARMYTTGTVRQLDLQYGVVNSGSLQIVGYDSNGTQLFASGYFAFALNGSPQLVEFALTVSGATVTAHVNTLLPGDWGQSGGGSSTSGSIGMTQRIVVNPNGSSVASAIGQIGVQSTYNFMDTSSNPDALIGPLNAWGGETAALRFARLCGEQGYACRIIGAPSASAAMGPQGISSFQALLQECEAADHGMIFEPRQALALGYRTSASMTNQALALSGAMPLALSYTAAQLGGGGGMLIQSSDDDMLTLNDETVTRGTTGITGSSLEIAMTGDAYAANSGLSTQAPPNGVGSYPDSRTVNIYADRFLPDQAGWIVHLGTVNELRYPGIPVDLARTAIQSLSDAAANLDLGDYLEITSPPQWLSADPVKAVVWGITEALGGYIWTLQWQTTPESPYETLIAGSGALSDCRADTDGSTLNTGVNSSATSLSVASSTARLWTTTAGDLPFDIIMGGERMTVTAVSGASSPQTFTVTRSVNGVAKSHSAGEAIYLFQPCYYALA